MAGAGFSFTAPAMLRGLLAAAGFAAIGTFAVRAFLAGATRCLAAALAGVGGRDGRDTESGNESKQSSCFEQGG